MSHRDKERGTGSRTHAQDLIATINELLADVDWEGLRFRRNCGWSVRGLATAALVWAWSSKTGLKERLDQSLRIARGLGSGCAPTRISYQAFIKLLVRWTPELRECLMRAFQSLMERAFPGQFRLAGYVVLAADSSKIQVARTRSNEKRYSPHARGRRRGHRKADRARRRPHSRRAQIQQALEKKADSPQMSLTLLFHLMLRLPWGWRLGPSAINERAPLSAMIPQLPQETLLVADCGFFGYEFWSELLASGRQFVIRVGSNVRLLKKLGIVRESHGTVYLWPHKAAKRGRQPLVLRLVVGHDGRQPWYLVTSVRDRQRLNDRQVVEIYRRRWRIELFFRHFKQTFGRMKLRSHKAEHAECEAQWSLLGFWAMLISAQIKLCSWNDDTRCLSVARVLRAFGRAIDEFLCRPTKEESLTQQLVQAVVDHYRRRNRHSRNFPRKKYQSPVKPPHITCATPSQRTMALHISPANSKRLTA